MRQAMMAPIAIATGKPTAEIIPKKPMLRVCGKWGTRGNGRGFGRLSGASLTNPADRLSVEKALRPLGSPRFHDAPGK